MADGPKNKKEINALQAFEDWCAKDRTTKGKSKLDKEEEQDWYSLSLGFFAAFGLSNAACHRLALHARYDLHYWC
jgi:hypothetical protein